MSRVWLSSDRPALVAALADRGITADGTPAVAALLIVAQGTIPAETTLAVLRQRSPAPVLMIVDDDEAAVIDAIDAGADDAVVHSASDRLIAARVAALIRRGSPRLITLGDLTIDTIERRVWREGMPIELLPREYRLLLELALHPGESISRAALLERVCGVGFDPGTNVLDVHVSRLRAKLDRDFAVPLLRTEKGVGYRLAVPAPDQFAIEAAITAR